MDQPRRITSVDKSYNHGDLSVFPNAIDGTSTLYEASNNAETRLKHSITAISPYLIVDDASSFPFSGIIKIIGQDPSNSEKIFYGKKIGNQLHLLQRGYLDSRQGPHPAGSLVTSPVISEQHNALKDAIIKIQRKIGLSENPDQNSIQSVVRALEQKWLSPKVVFKAFPRIGPAPLTVKFQNFSSGQDGRFLWDFGDGAKSIEKSPTHTFSEEGIYTVKLNMVSASGPQGFTEKANYIEVNNNQRIPFFYGRPLNGFSIKTAEEKNIQPTEITLIDQTDGDIVERHWFLGDDSDFTITNPNEHVFKYTYKLPGEYTPILLVRYEDNRISRSNIMEPITII